MTIDKIGPIDPPQNISKAGKNVAPNVVGSVDAVSVSNEARLKGEIYNVFKHVDNTTDIREDRVAETKQKIQDPKWIDSKILDTVAERIMDIFGV